MFTTAKLTAMKRWVSLPPIVWIGLAIVLGSWQPSALAETDCSAVTEIPKAQCETLIAIYDSTNGTNWTNNTGWQQTNTPCSWFGVTCANDVVTKIELNVNNLSGTLPELSALTNLQTFSLYRNKLTGSIPALDTLTDLQALFLYENQLSGSIPALDTLTNLQALHLHVNQLNGTIPKLNNLTNIQTVYLGKNQLTGSIPELSNLTNLKVLSLKYNDLSGTIPSLSSLTKLDKLWLEGNSLTGSIPDLSSLVSLTGMHLSANKLTGPIPDLSSLAITHSIYLGDNQLTGPIPDLSGVPNLWNFSVANNQLSGEIPSLASLSKLETFQLTGNSFCKGNDVDYAGHSEVNEYPVCGNPNITLTSPAHGATSIPISGQTFTWEPDPEASAHRIVISTLEDFSGFTDTFAGGDGMYCNDTTTCLTASNTGMQDYTVTLNLPENTIFYWKVRASKNPTFWSEVHSFTTGVAPKTGCNGDIQLPDNLCNGLTLYMPMNGNANDASGNGSDGVVNGATLTTDRHGNADSAYSFEDDYIEVPDSNGLDFTNEFTIGVWVNPDVQSDDIPTNGGMIISKEASYEFALTAGNSKIRYALKNSPSNWKWMNTGIVAPLNQWTFLTMSYDGSLFKLYKDGILEYQRSESGNISPTDAPLGIGARYAGPLIDFPSYWVSRFNGLIDDVSLYRRTLTDAEVQNLYDSSKPVTTGCNSDTQLPDDLCNGLVAYYPLDSNPNDASGNGNDGTEHDVNYGTGVVGNALDLDGTGYIRKENFNFTTADFSVAIWVKNLATDSTTRFLYAIHSGGDGTGQGDKTIDAHYYQNRAIRAILTTEDGQGAGSDTNQVANPGTILDEQNTWYHLVFTRQNGLLKLYKDGVRVSAVEERNVLPQFSVENGLLEIGAPNYYQGAWTNANGYERAKWLGMLDEMYLYNRGLSDAEIGRLYSQNQAVQSPTPISCANVTNAEIPANLQTGLFAYYSLDGHACDVSGNGNNNAVEYNTDFASGVVGQALQLDGTGYIQHRDFDFTAEDLTIALWAKASSKAERYLFAIHSGGTGVGAGDQTVNLHTRGSGNAIRVFLTTKDGQTSDEQIVMPVGGSIEPDNWYHIALVRQAGGSQKLYIDGVPVKAANEQNVLSQFSVENGFLEIGAPNYYKGGWNSGRENAKWQGMLDDVYLYTRALSDTEIQSLYNAASPVSQSMLEDAEDGGTDGWSIYDEKENGGAAFANVFDSEINSNVIELTGNSWSGYKLSFANSTNFIARWSAKTTYYLGDALTVYWHVKTSGAVIYMEYRSDKPLGCHYNSDSTYVTCGLDSSMRDKTWHTITRDLEADLKSIAPELDLIEVLELRIRMAGRIDDIQLLNRDVVNFHTISGTITNIYGKGISGISLSNSGADCQVSDDDGNYQCTVPEEWFGTLMPEKSNTHFFVPVTRNYSEVSDNLTEQDFTRQTIYHGLLGYWNFDNCDATDNSGNGFDGIVHSEPNCVDGVRGKGLKFDGTDDFIEINGGEVLANPVITTAAWIYKTADTKGVVLEKIDQLYRNGDNYLIGTTNKIGIGTEDKITDQDFGPSYAEAENDKWIHVAEVLTTEYVALYINGELYRKTIFPEGFVPYMGSAPLQIGGTPLSNHGSKMNAFFNSVIDEVYVYNRALSDAEIVQLANPNRVVAHYCFDDPDNLANDCGGNGLHGTLKGHTGEYQAGLSDGNAVELDGVDDFVDISWAKPNFMVNAFTIAVRFKTLDIEKAIQVPIWFRDDHPSIRIHNGNLLFGFRSNGSMPPKPLEDTALQSHAITEDWNCVVYTYDASDERTMRGYLNGMLIRQRKLDSDYTPSILPARIGLDDNGSRRFQGLIDDVQIYSYVLSDEEIADYQSICPPMEIPPEFVLEDAENGDTNGWWVYSDRGGSDIANVHDEVTDNHVVEFSGSPSSGYAIYTSNGRTVNKPIVQYRVKGQLGTTYWYLQSPFHKIAHSSSTRLGCNLHSKWNETHCGIEISIKDGEWHTITRDLAAELKESFPDTEISPVVRLSLRAAAQFDDIKFISRDAIDFYAITGKITHNGQGLSGVVLSGGGNCQPSDSEGNFQCSVPENWFGTLVPQKDGYIFEPFSLVYQNVASEQTTQNIIAKPTPTSDDEPVLHWTRDMHPIIGNGAVKLPGWWEDYVDDHFTVTVRAKPTAMKTQNYLFHADDASPGIRLNHENRVLFLFRPNDTAEPIPTSETTLLMTEPMPLNEWLEMTATWNGTEYVGYVNGQEIGRVALPKFIKGNRVAIGWDGGNDRAFEGEIAEVKIYKRALTFFSDCNTVTEIPTAQCETLLALYDNTGGDNWTNNDGWKKGNTPCNWYSIECTDGNVTKIDLSDNNLSGTIPDLSSLTSLMDLRLYSNQLTGSIPQLSALTQLQILFLNNNQLSGPIPELSALTDLQRIYLAINKLTGNVPELATLTKLQDIDFSHNKLTEAIPDLSALTKLTRIGLANNQLCQDNNADYAGRTEVEAFPICGEQPPEPVIAEPIVEGNSVTLDASGSSDPDPDGEITNHRWVTSDGQTATGANPTITFPADGEYTITLIVTDNTGKISELEQVVTIGAQPPTGPFKLTVSKRGTGEGSIQSTVPDTNIVCDTDCNRASSEYAKDTEVTIMATPASGSTFTNWTSCSKSTDSTITVTMKRRRSCTANFELDQTQTVLHRVRVVKIGDGNGLITVKQAGDVVTKCSTATCEPKFFAPGTELTFIARARNDATFVGWGEDCSGTDLKLPIIINAATKCTAEFTLPPPLPTQHRLTVTTIMETTAQGYVTGTGIECGDDCVENILAGKKARLKANPMPHSHFKEWANDCSGTRTSAAVIMDSDKTCTAIFGSDSDRNAEKLVEEFNDEAELIGGEKFTDVYPPIDNTECLLEAYRLTENVMIKVEEHLFLTGSWPRQFHNQEWYKPMPTDICTKSIKIISGGTDVKLAEGPVFVEGDYIKVEVELLTSVGVREILPILVYYGDKPEAEDANLRRRWARRYCCWRPRRRGRR